METKTTKEIEKIIAKVKNMMAKSEEWQEKADIIKRNYKGIIHYIDTESKPYIKATEKVWEWREKAEDCVRALPEEQGKLVFEELGDLCCSYQEFISK